MVLIIPLFISYTNHSTLESDQSFCPFKMLSGFPCPGCGITKSMVFFYEGDIYKSFYYHLFGPFVLLICVFLLFKFTVEFFKKQTVLEISYKNKKKIAFILATFLIIYHTIRIIYFIHNNSYQSILKESIWQ